MRITDLARGGRGVGRAGGLVLFVDGALPGEVAEVVVSRTHRAYAEARAVAILEPSPDRVPPPCPHYGLCGGCALQHLALEAQAVAKGRQVEAALQRLGGLADAPVRPARPAPEPWGYRFRMDFDWCATDSGPRLGLHRRGSRAAIVPIDRCLLAAPDTSALAAWLPGAAARRGLRARDPRAGRGVLRRVSVQEARGTREVLVTLETGAGSPPGLGRLADDLVRRFPRTVGVVRLAHLPGARRPAATILRGRDHLYEDVEGDRFRVPAEAFFQPNPHASLAVRREAIAGLRLTPGADLLELFGGVGFLTLAAARAGARAVVVESSAAACDAGRENLARVGGGARFVRAEVREALPGLLESAWDALLLDPPRTGLDPESARALGGARARRLVYVSCDPASLARDLSFLAGAGAYRLLEVTPFDLFPQTEHVECVAVLERS